MDRAPSFAGVILAAGRPGPAEALLPWRTGTVLSATIALLNRACDLVLVVAGEDAHMLRPVVNAQAAFLVQEIRTGRGPIGAWQAGLTAVLDRGRDAAIVTYANRPPCRPETLDRLRREFLLSPVGAVWAIAPEHEGVLGYPVVLGREMIETFLRAPAEATAMEIEQAHRERVRPVPVDDPWVAIDLDTPAGRAVLAANASDGGDLHA